MKFNFNNQQFEFSLPKIFPLISFLITLTILLGLTTWQLKRLVWKNNLINERVNKFESEPRDLDNILTPKDEEFRKVLVKGKLINDFELFMPALSKRGNNGYHILVPLKTSSGKNIIFDTGWVPLAKKNLENRKNNLNFSEDEFEAVLRLPGRKGYFQPENDPNGNFWFFVQPELMGITLEMKLEENFYLEAVNNGPNGFPLGNQTRIYLRNNHLQYAITWFLIAVGLIGVFFFANIKKVK
tara:strand:+ start:1699 stop:2421 length:723 start_codon:yes stop_codon:yes gene_type:complete